MTRLRSDFWVSAHLRRCAHEGVDAVLRRRGSPEAGAVFVSVDRLDGRIDLFGPAPQSLVQDEPHGRRFAAIMMGGPAADVEARMGREIGFDPDLWWLSIDDREGRSLLELSSSDPARDF